jgi:hypothetical protein
MAKNSVRDFDATAANNTDIQSVDIAENCAPSGINNAIRELMADIKDVSAGTVALESPQADSMTVTGDLTVDTSTLKVDSTNNRVGILEASPTVPLEVKGAQGYASSASNLSTSTTKAAAKIRGSSDASTSLFFGSLTNDAEQYIQSANGAGSAADDLALNPFGGNVGVGLVNPDTPLEVQIGSSGNALKLSSSADGASVFLAFEHQESGTKHVRGRIRAASNGVEGGLIFETGASSSTSEALRIDNSRKLLIGKTVTTQNTAGTVISATDGVRATVDGNVAALLNRTSSDGSIVSFRKDGSEVGSIGAVSGDVFFAGVDSNHAALRFAASSKTVIPVTVAGALSDNTTDLGQSNAQFDDIFASNSTIQPSDQTMKQDIASLTSAEITAAKAISKLFKTFKWKDKVTSKGDSARTHAGVIAQEVQSAMSDAGLDATKYAFFCSDTWYETYTDVPAVEANEENGTEEQDAYTRTDTYNTADEAPEGATERTRLGIRYPELLAFVGAATEQRLAEIETRLTALEA